MDEQQESDDRETHADYGAMEIDSTVETRELTELERHGELWLKWGRYAVFAAVFGWGILVGLVAKLLIG